MAKLIVGGTKSSLQKNIVSIIVSQERGGKYNERVCVSFGDCFTRLLIIERNACRKTICSRKIGCCPTKNILGTTCNGPGCTAEHGVV